MRATIPLLALPGNSPWGDSAAGGREGTRWSARLAIWHARRPWLAATGVAGSACRQEMYDQPKYKDLRESGFFADRRQARPVPAGTVARGFLREETGYADGRVHGALTTTFPVSVSAALLDAYKR